MSFLLRAYNSSLARRPLATQMATAGTLPGMIRFGRESECDVAFLFGSGDVLAQQAIERKGAKHDVRAYSQETRRLVLTMSTVRANSAINIVRR